MRGYEALLSGVLSTKEVDTLRGIAACGRKIIRDLVMEVSKYWSV